MTTLFQKKHLPKLFVGLALLSSSFLFSCNDTSTKKEEPATVAPAKDSMAAGSDSLMKMKSDSTTDTTTKGGQPTPPRN